MIKHPDLKTLKLLPTPYSLLPTFTKTLFQQTQITKTEQIYAVIGGMHLLQANHQRLTATVETLKKYQVKLLGANHCTGTSAIAFLWQELKSLKCLDCRVGTQLRFT